jgi:hypothetical protein
MGEMVTISIPKEIKEFIERYKGDREWGDYLLDACTKAQSYDQIMRNITAGDTNKNPHTT